MRSPFVSARPLFIGLAALGVTLSALALDAEQSARQSATVIPQGRAESWWVERHQATNARVSKGDIDLVWIGDSITQAWESEGREVWKEYYGKRKALNLGFSGDRTQHVLWRLAHGNIDGISPKAVVIMIGTNNSNGDDCTADQIVDGVRAIVRTVREKLPQTRVLLLGIFPRGERPNAQRGKIAAVNSSIARLADGESVRFLDIGDRLMEDDGRISPKIMPDFLHLSSAGYEIWAKAVEPALTEMLGEKGASE